MKTVKPNKGKQATTLRGEPFFGVNYHDSIGKLDQGEYLELENVDIQDGYLTDRRPYEASPMTLPSDQDIWAYISFNSEEADQEVFMYHPDNASHNWYSDEAGDFLQVKNWGGSGTYFTPSFGQYGQYVYAGGKIFGISYNQIIVIEFVRVLGVWEMWGRDIGMGDVQIQSVTPTVTGDANDIPQGEYIYAVELVRKQTGSSAAIASGSPNRLLDGTDDFATLVVATGDYATAKIAIAVSDLISVPWCTHVRLWRTKSTIYNEDTAIPGASQDVLNLIDEVTYAVAIAPGSDNDYEFIDFRKDEDIPVYKYGSQTLSDSADYEQSPLPPARVGTYYKNRLWLGNIKSESTGFINDNGNVVASGVFGSSLYNELYNPTQVVTCDSEDGYGVTSLQGVSGDMIVFKENSTGIIANANPIATDYEVIDAVIGVPYINATDYVPALGVIGVVNDRDSIQFFGSNQRWSRYIDNHNFSDNLRGEDGVGKTVTKLRAVYWEGKLLLSLNEDNILYVLHIGEGFYWTKYNIEYQDSNESEGVISSLFLQDKGRLCHFSLKTTVAAQTLSIMNFQEYSDTDDLPRNDITGGFLGSYTIGKVPWTVKTKPFESDEGRNLLEHRYLSIEAAVERSMSVSVYVTNGNAKVKDSEAFSLFPTFYIQGAGIDPPPFQVNDGSVVEYQYYTEDNFPERKRVYAERLIYEITGSGKMEMYPPVLYVLLHFGARKPDYNFSEYADQETDLIYDRAWNDRAIHLTRPDMLENNTTGEKYELEEI